MNSSEALLTAAETADRLAISLATLYRRVKQGKLRAIRPRGGRRLYFPRADVEAYVDRDATGAQIVHMLMRQRFTQLPDAFALDFRRDLGFMRGEFHALFESLKREPHPYFFWGEMMWGLAEAIEELEASEVFAMMVDNEDSLCLRHILERDLRENVSAIREKLEFEDEVGTTDLIRRFHARMQHWLRFCRDWSAFRQAARDCFDPGWRVTPDSYKELRHPGEVWYCEGGPDTKVNWNAMLGLVSRPDLMDRIADFIAEAIEGLGWQFDSFCQLSAAAHGLALLLGLKRGRRHVAMDNETFNFLPPDPTPDMGKRLVLVDTVTQSGRHLATACQKARQAGREIEGAIFIAINDKLCNPEERLSITDDMQREKKLLYCFKLSSLQPPSVRQ